jgi:hypothetical protein
VAAARRDGRPVWAEVTPHHLTHTGDMEAEIGRWGKVNPPLRVRADCERLWRAFHDGWTFKGMATTTFDSLPLNCARGFNTLAKRRASTGQFTPR